MHEHEPTQEVIQQETVPVETIRSIARVVIPYAGTEPIQEEHIVLHQVSEFRANLPA